MNLTVKESAEILGGSEQWVRSLCTRGLCGDAWSSGRYRKTYVILSTKLAKFMEISVEELERRVEKMREGRSVYVH